MSVEDQPARQLRIPPNQVENVSTVQAGTVDVHGFQECRISIATIDSRSGRAECEIVFSQQVLGAETDISKRKREVLNRCAVEEFLQYPTVLCGVLS